MRHLSTNKRFSSIDISPDDLAAQLTLMDLPIFKSIKRDELTSLGSKGSSPSLPTIASSDASNKEMSVKTKTMVNSTCCSAATRKQELSPNIVAMNRQFNQVTFWVVSQILSYESPRYRAELISHFIKAARRLYLLNNLHSSYAVISALLISPIYRLDKTWHFVKKKHPKEKAQFEYLTELYSDNNNYLLLRNHLDTCDLPCIPYLGMYSRDIIYINEVYSDGTLQRTKATSKILKSIERFQSSNYDHLVYMPDIHNYLLSNRYIDELQKFVEDENYRRSLELEPSDNANHSHYIDHSADGHGHGGGGFVGVGSRSLKRSTMLLASMVQSAVFSTSSKFVTSSSGSTSPRRSSDGSQKSLKYLIDDSFIDSNHHQHHTILPPMSTSS